MFTRRIHTELDADAPPRRVWETLTDLAFVPFAIGWMALGRSVYTCSRADG